MSRVFDPFSPTTKQNGQIGEIGKMRLNRVIHQPVRLRIMAVLMATNGQSPIEFPALRDLLDLTDGNLGAHLQKLEESRYIEMNRTDVFRGRPLTYISATPQGRRAFREHTEALSSILSWS